jgi:hypothetical protein
MPKYRVSLAFAELPDDSLDDFTGAIIAGVTGNAAFPTPPVAVAQLTTLKTAFESALAARGHGPVATAAKNNAREALIDALRKDANYVENQSNNDLAVLLSSGYEAASTNRAQAPLEKVQIIAVDHSQSGQLKLRIVPVDNAKGFDGRIKNGTADYGPPESFASSRAIVFKNLTPGTTYTMQVRAVGGSTGTGDWSDPISHMAI